jgi:hypothetical protein
MWMLSQRPCNVRDNWSTYLLGGFEASQRGHLVYLAPQLQNSLIGIVDDNKGTIAALAELGKRL